MRRHFIIPAIALVALTACQTSSLTEEQQEPVTQSDEAYTGSVKEIDAEKSTISFVGRSNIINHEGKFNAYTVTITPDSAEPSNLEKATITANIDLTSIEVDAAGLQGHLAKDDFFAVEQYPNATFTSTSITSKGDNMYDVTGDLTVKGVTKSATFEAEITDDYLTAHYELPRKDFGIGNDNYGDKLLEPLVPIDIKLVFQQ